MIDLQVSLTYKIRLSETEYTSIPEKVIGFEFSRNLTLVDCRSIRVRAYWHCIGNEQINK